MVKNTDLNSKQIRMAADTLKQLNREIIQCNKCKRLTNFRVKISNNKRKEYINEDYWAKPITGFGDINAEILIVGLAPAAHGGTRTGRVFTGDKSSDFLYKCLYEAKMTNQEHSISKNDGLELYNTYITTALKCVPPNDKPTSEELNECSKYFKRELECIKNSIYIVALGKIAFDAIIKYYSLNISKFSKRPKFKHGEFFDLPDNKKLVACYHPSPRNVNTGRLNKNMMVKLFKNILK